MHHAVGFIHGRFQVLHNDHLKYLLAGKALCDHLIVGITNPTPETTAEESANPARSDARNNPLTYEERETMIRAAFDESDIPEDTYSIVPFPICKPEMLAENAPKDAVYYLTIYDEWGREKLRRLQSIGLQTHVMWEKDESEKGLNGTDIRAAIRDDSGWEEKVPKAVAKLVREWNLKDRMV